MDDFHVRFEVPPFSLPPVFYLAVTTMLVQDFRESDVQKHRPGSCSEL